MTKQEIEDLVDSTMREEFRHFDLRPEGDRVGPRNDETPRYLKSHTHEYIRTIDDIVRFAEPRGSLRVLEIGAFFGMVSICLAKLGFRVCAADIPEYMLMPEQKDRFGKYGIEIAEVRLKDYLLPFAEEAFDVIIMCEVLEHLNFNPLPLIKEINRVGAPDSLFYLSLPNLAYYRKRLQLLFGKQVMQSVDEFFDQLDPENPLIVNGHWREYTGPEVAEMLRRMGYEIRRQYYFSIVDALKRPTLKNRVTRLAFGMVPSFKENQTTLAIRRKRCDLAFRIPRTVHETLEAL